MNTNLAFNRFCAATNIIGGTCVAIAYTLHPHHASADVVSGMFWLIIHILFSISLIFGAFGLTGLFYRHLKNSRLTGMIGFILAVTSLIGISGLNFFETFINPVIATELPLFVDRYGAGTGIGHVKWLFPLLGIFFLAGYELLCWDMIRSKSLQVHALSLTMVGTLVFGIGLSGLLPMIVVQIGSVMFGAGLISLGIASYTTKDEIQ